MSTYTCPFCGGSEFSQDTDDFDRGIWDRFRCDSCLEPLREVVRTGPAGDICSLRAELASDRGSD
jgi:hypothetical protein